MNVERVALLPVVFRDSALDRYYQMRAGDEIRRQARKELMEKGYKVDFIDDLTERKFWQPYALPETDPARLAELARRDADALVIIWVDNFLDAGLYEREAPQSLQIYATSVMISTKSKSEIWRGEGVGRGGTSFLSPSSLDMELLLAPAELAESLFVTLPNAVD